MTLGSSTRAARTPPRGDSFRYDIGTLRALAVTAVVLYHLWPHRLTGGYVGVDVFFVISGFLITGHLVTSIEKTGRITLSDFWARRIRRLLPAALTVIAFWMIAAFTVLPNVVLNRNLGEMAASALYLENWKLGFDAVNYLASENSPSLVQHYWSLSVEEQFYLVWPLLLILAAWVARQRGYAARRTIAWMLVAVLVLSGAAAGFLTPSYPSWAFFSTPTRAFEFAAGGLVAVFASRWAAAPSRLLVVIRLGGLLIIVASCFAFDGTTNFPGWIASVPVAGTALAIVGGFANRSTVRFDRLRPIQHLGEISYSVYLWHWPLIIAAPYVVHRDLGTLDRWIILGITLVAAELTRRWVEDPVRRGQWWVARRWPAYSGAIVGGLVILTIAWSASHVQSEKVATNRATIMADIDAGEPCIGAAASQSPTCRDPYGRTALTDPAMASDDFDAAQDGCQQSRASVSVRWCEVGETSAPRHTVAIVGNSHALRLVAALTQFGKTHGWDIRFAIKTDCLGLVSSPLNSPTESAACVRWSADVQRSLLNTPGLSAVIFASHVEAQDYLAGTDAAPSVVAAAGRQVVQNWQRLKDAGIPVVVTTDVPGTRPVPAPECVARSTASTPCSVPRDQVAVPNMLVDLSKSRPDLTHTMDLQQFMCDSAHCHAVVGGLVVYSDSHHLTSSFAASMGPFIGPEIEASFRP